MNFAVGYFVRWHLQLTVCCDGKVPLGKYCRYFQDSLLYSAFLQNFSSRKLITKANTSKKLQYSYVWKQMELFHINLCSCTCVLQPLFSKILLFQSYVMYLLFFLAGCPVDFTCTYFLLLGEQRCFFISGLGGLYRDQFTTHRDTTLKYYQCI